MNPLRLFRVLIFAQMAIVALAIAASVRLEKTLPGALQSYLRARQDAPFDSKEVGVGAAAIILLAAMVAAGSRCSRPGASGRGSTSRPSSAAWC
jgi:hypothetical protein